MSKYLLPPKSDMVNMFSGFLANYKDNKCLMGYSFGV